MDHWEQTQEILNQNTNSFFGENAFENVVCKMSAIVFMAQCVKEYNDLSYEQRSFNQHWVRKILHFNKFVVNGST